MGYDSIVITNTKCSEEKKATIRLGSKLMIEPNDYEAIAMRMKAEDENLFHIDQYNNVKNADT